jgi:hypothetical protein
MDADGDPGDVFAIPDFWNPSPYTREAQESHSFLFSELRFDGGKSNPNIWSTYAEATTDINEKLPPNLPQPQLDDGFFGLPDLSFGVLVDISTPSTSAEPSHMEEGSEKAEEQEAELWMSLKDEPLKGADYLSWDAFEDQAYEEPHTAYITEAGPGIFDAILADESDVLSIRNTKHLIIKSHIYAASLLWLGLGRSSVLFTWDDEKKCFKKRLDPIRIPGCTGETVDGLLATFMSCGNATKALQEFIDRTYQAHKSPGRIAMADAVSTLLSTLQSRLSIPVSSMKSLLQLQALFKPVESLLTSFHLMVESAASEKNDEAMLSKLFHEVQRLENRTESMREILLEVLARVSRPFLDFMGEWIGTQREAGVPLEKRGLGRSFVKVEDRTWIDEQGLEMQEPDFILDADKIPSFITVDDAQTMFETGRSLRFIRTHHPDHPLARADIVLSATPPKLDWNFSWQNIEQVEAKALKYEKDLAAAIKHFSKDSAHPETQNSELPEDGAACHQLDILGMPKEQMEAHVLTSIAMLNELPSMAGTSNKLSELLNNCLAGGTAAAFDGESTFAPHISLTPILSFSPIIAAQARIVNGTSMRLFFQAHNLREHLIIQRRFQLLGDGVFSSRLSHALFDPELETAERRAGVARTGGIMGLRLEGRDSWPPASSELRLSLMGVLTESYVFTASGGREHAGGYLDRKNELPGDLSFAVRDMSDEEIEKCRDPNSVEALDFLRLSYKPPPPLEAVITPMCLYKYDQLFKLLLRVMRMLFVVSQLFRDALGRTSYWQGIDTTAQRFRIEAHHFISCISGYFFDTGIDATWRIFERKLDQIEKRINDDADHVVLGQNEGLDKLREYHERVLDRIMFALLLRKRQQPVMKLLEDIFTLILHFAKHSRSRALGVTRRIGPDQEVKEMYLKFRKKVEVFITVCRGLSEKKGYGEKRVAGIKGMPSGGLFDSEELAEENTIVQLLARLEMSNYYSRPVNV